jgi:hypothetical protein
LEGSPVNSRLLFALALVFGVSFSQADADHHKKNKDNDSAALTECTIQSSGGGGCKGGFKRVCQKLKNGDKCCGCVPDKNAKTQQPPAKTRKTSCDTIALIHGDTDVGAKEAAKNACITNHPGADFNCRGEVADDVCCCYFQE